MAKIEWQLCGYDLEFIRAGLSRIKGTELEVIRVGDFWLVRDRHTEIPVVRHAYSKRNALKRLRELETNSVLSDAHQD